MTSSISIVIPTKNRPIELVLAIRSVLIQTTRPQQLIIVDQSPFTLSRDKITEICSESPDIELIYIHDPSISGLPCAKASSLSHSNGDLICFLEDDIELSENYLEQIVLGFRQCPTMLGCCGLVVGDDGPSFLSRMAFHLFHRGIFLDRRPNFHGFYSGTGHTLASSRTLSGGISAWRSEVFNSVEFDTVNDFFMLEDIEFSTRAAVTLGDHFYINPNAQLRHHASPVNRDRLPDRQRRKVRECIVFYRKRRSWPWAHLSIGWLLAGLLAEAVFLSTKFRSIGLLSSYFQGLRDGIFWKVRVVV